MELSREFDLFEYRGRSVILWRPSRLDPWHMVLELDPVNARGLDKPLLASLRWARPMAAEFCSYWPEGQHRGELYTVDPTAGRILVGHWLTGHGGPVTEALALEITRRISAGPDPDHNGSEPCQQLREAH